MTNQFAVKWRNNNHWLVLYEGAGNKDQGWGFNHLSGYFKQDSRFPGVKTPQEFYEFLTKNTETLKGLGLGEDKNCYLLVFGCGNKDLHIYGSWN